MKARRGVNKPWVGAIEKDGVYIYEVRAWTKCGAVKKLDEAQNIVPSDLVHNAK